MCTYRKNTTLSVSLHLFLCLFLSVCLSLSVSVCLSLSLCLCLSVSLSLPLCLSVCLSLFEFLFCYKIVTEYERAVIFRLGRVVSGRAKGPGRLLCLLLKLSIIRSLCYMYACVCAGLFFIFPCLDSVRKIDLRTISFDIPPQEVCIK